MLKRNIGHAFWVFIFFIIFLQLSTNKDLPIFVALLYSTSIVLILKLFLNFYLKKYINKYLINGDLKKILAITLSLSLLSSAILIVFGYAIFRLFLPEQVFEDFKADMISTFFGLLSFTTLFSGVNFSFALLKQKTEAEKQEQILKNTLLEMELDHLRMQLSPHFTFNILNNLQFLIRKDKEAALELLARYSSILRYYVYESNNKWIKLNDEISFLKHYIQLETGRASSDLQLAFNWNISDNNLVVLPFVLSTFIENAFKHVSAFLNKDNSIKLDIFLESENILNFNILNTFNSSAMPVQHEGVGLQNAKKRLDLVYKDKYILNINTEGEYFEVNLQIQLTEISI